MVKYILGGVALIATGYGLKKLIDDNDGVHIRNDYSSEANKQSDISPELEEVIKEYEEINTKLFNGSLAELRTALSEIKNLDKEVVFNDTTNKPLNEEIFSRYLDNSSFIINPINRDGFDSLDNGSIEKLENFTQILKKTDNYISENLDDLDTIIISSNDFETYSKEDKKFVENLTYLCTEIEKIYKFNINTNKMLCSREIIRGYGKVETLIS